MLSVYSYSLQSVNVQVGHAHLHPPTQETTALAVEECVTPGGDFPAYPYLASADFAAGRMTRRSLGCCAANRFSAHWRSRLWLLGTTPACRNSYRERQARWHFGVQARACPWGSIALQIMTEIYRSIFKNILTKNPIKKVTVAIPKLIVAISENLFQKEMPLATET